MPETKPSPAFQVGACGVTRSGTVWTAVELRPHLNGDPAYVVAESAKGVRRVFYAFEWFGLRVA